MPETVCVDSIEIDRRLYEFVVREAIPGTGIAAEDFWRGFAALVSRLAAPNAALMQRRDSLQSQIDAWHRVHPGAAFDPASYRAFLLQIGYLVPEQRRFPRHDRERRCGNRRMCRPTAGRTHQQCALCLECGQRSLGQPVRCSLWDRRHAGGGRAPRHRLRSAARRTSDRLRARVSWTSTSRLQDRSHRDATGYRISGARPRGRVHAGRRWGAEESAAPSRDFRALAESPSLILLKHHGLHVELCIDRTHHIGRDDPAGLQRRRSRIRRHHHSGLRGFGRRGHRRGQSARSIVIGWV